MKQRRRIGLAGATAVAIALGLSACGPPPWEVEGGGTPASSPTSTPTAVPTITPIVNDLATGSAKRSLHAGPATLAITYYSPLDLGKWTASANKPLKSSLTATLANDEKQAVYLSKVTVSAAVEGPHGPLPAPPTFVDQAVVGPGNYIKDPYAYELTYVIPPLDPAATSITLSFAYDVLVQTTPTSGEYAKSSAFDTLTIAIAPTK